MDQEEGSFYLSSDSNENPCDTSQKPSEFILKVLLEPKSLFCVKGKKFYLLTYYPHFSMMWGKFTDFFKQSVRN